MSRNYPTPTTVFHAVDGGREGLIRWADSHQTDMPVAVAIHAIAGAGRSAEAIWEAPTAAEWDNVTMAVAEYIRLGDFEASDDGRYCWGEEMIEVAA